MKRLTERIVSSGRSPASSRAPRPTTTSPPAWNATADGRSRSPVAGSVKIRGPSASSTATRLLVVPRSMPIIRPTQSLFRRVFHVSEQRPQICDLAQPSLELVERRWLRTFVLARQPVLQAAHALLESGPQGAYFALQGLRLTTARGAQLRQPLLGLEHLGRDLRRH